MPAPAAPATESQAVRNTVVAIFLLSGIIALLLLFRDPAGGGGVPATTLVSSGAAEQELAAAQAKILGAKTAASINAPETIAQRQLQAEQALNELPASYKTVKRLWFANRAEIDAAYSTSAGSAAVVKTRKQQRREQLQLPPIPGEFPAECSTAAVAPLLLSTWLRTLLKHGDKRQNRKRQWHIVDWQQPGVQPATNADEQQPAATTGDFGLFLAAVLDAFGSGNPVSPRALGRELFAVLAKRQRSGGDRQQQQRQLIAPEQRLSLCGCGCACAARPLELKDSDRERRQTAFGAVSLFAVGPSRAHDEFLRHFFSSIVVAPKSARIAAEDGDEGAATPAPPVAVEKESEDGAAAAPSGDDDEGKSGAAAPKRAVADLAKQRRAAIAGDFSLFTTTKKRRLEDVLPPSVKFVDVLRVVAAPASAASSLLQSRYVSQGRVGLLILDEPSEQPPTVDAGSSSNGTAPAAVAASLTQPLAALLTQDGKFKCFIPLETAASTSPSAAVWWNTELLTRRLAPWRPSMAQQFPEMRTSLVCVGAESAAFAPLLNRTVDEYNTKGKLSGARKDSAAGGKSSKDGVLPAAHAQCGYARFVADFVPFLRGPGEKMWAVAGAPPHIKGLVAASAGATALTGGGGGAGRHHDAPRGPAKSIYTKEKVSKKITTSVKKSTRESVHTKQKQRVSSRSDDAKEVSHKSQQHLLDAIARQKEGGGEQPTAAPPAE